MSEPLFESVNEEEIFIDAKDYTDVVRKDKNRKKLIKILVGIVLALTSFAAGFFIYTIIAENRVESIQEEVYTPQSSQQSESEDTTDLEQPLTELYPDAPKPNKKPIITERKKNKIIAGSTEIVFKDVKLSSIINKCEVSRPTDFCLSAIGEFENNTLNIYFMKDAVHSKLFITNEFSPVEIKGSPAAAIIEINIAGEEGKVLVVTAKNSSGFMIALPHEMTDEEVESLVKNITIK